MMMAILVIRKGKMMMMMMMMMIWEDVVDYKNNYNNLATISLSSYDNKYQHDDDVCPTYKPLQFFYPPTNGFHNYLFLPKKPFPPALPSLFVLEGNPDNNLGQTKSHSRPQYPVCPMINVMTLAF